MQSLKPAAACSGPETSDARAYADGKKFAPVCIRWILAAYHSVYKYLLGVIHPSSFKLFLMDNHTEQILDHSAPTDPLPPDPLPLILDGISDPEEDDIFDVQSFDEDDMYDSDGSSDGEDGEDDEVDMAVPIPESDDGSQPIPESRDSSQEPLDDVIMAHLDSMVDKQTPMVTMVCHQTLNGVLDF